MKLPSIFHSKITLLVILVVLLGVFALELQQWKQRRTIDNEINHLIQQQSELERHNQALEQSLHYFSTDNYKEKLAREQLGLKKEGEIVVNYPINGITAQQPENIQPKNNPQKWWEFIFTAKGDKEKS